MPLDVGTTALSIRYFVAQEPIPTVADSRWHGVRVGGEANGCARTRPIPQRSANRRLRRDRSRGPSASDGATSRVVQEMSRTETSTQLLSRLSAYRAANPRFRHRVGDATASRADAGQ